MKTTHPLMVGVAFVILAGVVPVVSAGQDSSQGRVEMLHVRGPIYMIAAGGGNITASIGPDGVLLVDTGTAEMSQEVLAVVRELQRQHAARAMFPPEGGAETRSAAQMLRDPSPPPPPIRYVVNTHAHPDHTGGNATLATVPRRISFQSPEAEGELATRVFAHENVLLRLSGAEGADAAVPFESWPSDTYFTALYKFSRYFNGEGIQLTHIPSAHTDGDSIVWFRGSDVISTGDIYSTTGYPIPDLERGGSIQGVIEGLNLLLDLAIPEYRAEGGTLVIPGHGRLSDFGDLAHYRDLVTIIRDRVRDMIDRGMTLEEVKVARPSFEYDVRYGRQPGSADRFIEAVFQSLTEIEED